MADELLQQQPDAPAPEQAQPEAEQTAHVDAGDDGDAPSPEIEAKAREIGWVPRDQWRGNPDVWRPADEYVRRGEEVLPIVRSNLEKERARVADLQAQLERSKTEFDDRLRRQAAMQQRMLEQQKHQIHQQYIAAKREAAASGDLDRYDNLDRGHAAALREFDAQHTIDEPPPTPQAPISTPPPEVKAFFDKHAGWWGKDNALTEEAIALHGVLLKTRRDLSLADNLAEVEKRLSRNNPEKFPTRTPAPAASLEGGSRAPASSAPRGKGWNDIPREERAGAERWIKQDGMYLPDGVRPETATEKDLAIARAAYAKEYWAL